MRKISGTWLRKVMIVLGGLATIAVLVPVGAQAAGQFVTIVDGDDTQVDVTANGHLLVTNSDKAPLTVRAGDSFPVKGEIGTYPQPGQLHVQGRRLLGEGDRVGAFGSARHFSYADKVAITSITLSALSYYNDIGFYALAGTNCDTANFQGPRRAIYIFHTFRETDVHVTFPEPLLVSTPSPGTTTPWCVIVAPTGGELSADVLDVLTIGHVIPST